MTNSANLHTKHIDRCNPNSQRLFGWPIFKVLLLDSSPSYIRTKEKTTQNHLLHAAHIRIQSQFLLNFFSLSCDDSWLIARSVIHPSRFLFTWRLKWGLWWKKNFWLLVKISWDWKASLERRMKRKKKRSWDSTVHPRIFMSEIWFNRVVTQSAIKQRQRRQLVIKVLPLWFMKHTDKHTNNVVLVIIFISLTVLSDLQSSQNNGNDGDMLSKRHFYRLRETSHSEHKEFLIFYVFFCWRMKRFLSVGVDKIEMIFLKDKFA